MEPSNSDPQLIAARSIKDLLLEIPNSKERIAQVFRDTFDQLYDGGNTGRYRWDQLYKTEKTHYGTLFEINFQREFDFQSGDVLDYKILDTEIDCKYSATQAWMLPPEVFGKLFFGCYASDEKSQWGIGIGYAHELNRRKSSNRDLKTGLTKEGKMRVDWIYKDEPMPPNILLQIDSKIANHLVDKNRSGQQRVNDLFSLITERIITRNVVATVAQQKDPLKRVRGNGGARTHLQQNGILILSGDYANQVRIAADLGILQPSHGEFISVRVGPANSAEPGTALIDGGLWRRLRADEDTIFPAPTV